MPSTNSALIAALKERPSPPPHGAVYRTDAQTAGRGQGGNGWHSSPGANLTLSLLLRPDDLAVDRVFALTQCTALAVREVVSTSGPAQGVSVKWPNDVYVGNRKIAGILIQNGLRGRHLQWSVVGIGLNVNELGFPEPLRQRATSLRELTGTPHDLDQIAQSLYDALGRYYTFLETADWQGLERAYLHHLYRRGVVANYRNLATGRVFQGSITGVDALGRLRMHTPGGACTFDLREVAFLPD